MNTPDAMITTIDNPYSPFTQFDAWYAFDEQAGYHTCEYVDRIMITSSELGEHEETLDYYKAIDAIIELNVTGKYTRTIRHNK